MPAGEPVLYSLYIYEPNRIAPIIFVVAYAISAVFHIWQCYRYKTFKLFGLHPVCAVLFSAGYALRAYASYDSNYIYDDEDDTPLLTFIMSQVFIYICPPLLELANYHVLGRLFYYVPDCAPLPAGRVLSIFGGLMLFVEILNSLGVSLASNSGASASTQSLGGDMTIAAVALQLVLIISFFVLVGIFQRRCARANLQTRSVTTMLVVLVVSMLLILVRSIYRLIEHAGNGHMDIQDIDALRQLSPLLRYEVFFYVFEATLMLLNSALWNVWHPGRFLPTRSHIYLSLDGVEVEGTKEADNRSAAAKALHILSFGLLFRSQRNKGQSVELSEASV